MCYVIKGLNNNQNKQFVEHIIYDITNIGFG